MHPTPPKKEEDAAICLDKWCTQVDDIERHGASHKLADVYKMAALRVIMIGKAKDHFETLENLKLEEALTKCKGYAIKRRIESEQKKDSKSYPMDVWGAPEIIA